VPYIVVKSNGLDVALRELDCPLVVGRAPDCDLTVHDILLSRRHLRLEATDDGWIVQDLQSKNGTVINGERIRFPRVLRDNDVVRFGRSKLVFHAGLPDEDFAEQLLSPARPATPGDTLSGTLSGFTLLLPGEGDIPQDIPNPQPRPRDPPAYDRAELQTLLAAIASSSWDSVYAEARQPLRGGQGFETDDEVRDRPRVRPSSPTDLSLQANPVTPVAAPAAAPKIRRNFPSEIFLHGAVSGIWIVLLVLLNMSQKATAIGSTPPMVPNEPAAHPAAVHSDSDNLDDQDAVKAADPQPADQQGGLRPVSLNLQTGKTAALTASMYLPVIW
jgi:pSer/pThr/pTyr-binding forkhead associated (FHA) protein